MAEDQGLWIFIRKNINLSDFKFDFRFGNNRIFREDSMILTFHVAPLASRYIFV